MKFLRSYYFALLLLLPVVGFATITAEKEYALNRMNGTAQKYALGTELAKTPNVVVGKYSFAVQGGANNSSVLLLRSLTDTTSNITIPDNAIVKQVYVDTISAVTGGSISAGLASDTDLVAAKDDSLFSGVIAGTPINTAATMIKLSANKKPYLKFTNGAVTAGKVNVYIEYVLGD